MLSLPPYPTSIDPRIPIMRSAEWCPYPLKCMITKQTCSTRKMTSGACTCINCILFRNGAA